MYANKASKKYKDAGNASLVYAKCAQGRSTPDKTRGAQNAHGGRASTVATVEKKPK